MGAWFSGAYDKAKQKVDDANYKEDTTPHKHIYEQYIPSGDPLQDQQEGKFKVGTKAYDAVKALLVDHSIVTSPTQTKKRADFAIRNSGVAKPFSVGLTVMTILMHLEPLIIPNWAKYLVSLLISIGAELWFGHESKSIFNKESHWSTRLSGAVIAMSIASVLFYSHFIYKEKIFSDMTATNQTTVSTGKMSSPTITRINGEIDVINSAIEQEKQRLASENANINDKRIQLQTQIDAYNAKADTYKNIVDKANANPRGTGCKRRKGKIRAYGDGKCQYLSTITKWSNANREKAKRIGAEKSAISSKTSPKIANLQVAKVELLGKLEAEQNNIITEKNTTSGDTADIILAFLIMIEIMSKMELYGYWIQRMNISNDLLDKISEIADFYSSMSPIKNAIAHLTRQGANIAGQLAQSVDATNQQLQAIISSNAIKSRHIVQSNFALLQYLQSENYSDSPAYKPTVDKDGNVIHSNANYNPIGDKDTDLDFRKKQERDANDIAEKETTLTEYVKSKGFDNPVKLDPHIVSGEIRNGTIYLSSQLSDSDLAKALKHELAHLVTGSPKHDKKFKDTLKAKKGDKPLQNIFKRRTPPQGVEPETVAVIPRNRSEIVLDGFYNEENPYLPEEIELFRSFGIWDEMRNIIDTDLKNHIVFFHALHYRKEVK